MSKSKAQKRPTNSNDSFLGYSEKSAKDYYEALYGKQLTDDEVDEMKFNLIGYIELLIQLDKQHKEWLQLQA